MFRFANFFIVELTLSCNLSCEYCYLKDRHEYTGMTMSDETFQNFIDHVIYQQLEFPTPTPPEFVFHGGEPLLLGKESIERKLKYMVDAFKEYDLQWKASVQTNGVLLTREFADVFTKYGVSIGISYDGDEGHNSLRTGNNKSLEDTILSNIKEVENSGAYVGILSVISSENIDHIQEFEKKLGRIVKRIRVTDTSTPEKGAEVDPLEYFNVLEKDYVESLEWVSIPSGEVRFDLDRMLYRAVADQISQHSDSCQNTCGFKFCGSGLRILAIQPNGAVHMCDRWDLKHREEYYLHEPHSYDFLGIKQLKRAIQFNSILHNVNKDTGCDTCYARYICGHQCQSLYYSKFGKYGVDKKQICARTKAVYDFVSDNIEKILAIIIKNGSFTAIEDVIFAVKQRAERVSRGVSISPDMTTITFPNEGVK